MWRIPRIQRLVKQWRQRIVIGFLGILSILTFLILPSCQPGEKCTICSFKPRICLCRCGNGRRPPVYAYGYKEIIDYEKEWSSMNDCCEPMTPCEDSDEEEEAAEPIFEDGMQPLPKEAMLNAPDEMLYAIRCDSPCKDSCNKDCDTGCENCDSPCKDSCSNDCGTGCGANEGNGCQKSCGSSCKDSCSKSCGKSCQSSCDRPSANPCDMICQDDDSCGNGKGLPPELTDRNQPLMEEYHVAIGDLLEISVFGDEDTHVDNVIVAPDGRIYYLFLDGMVAEGKTLEELRKEIETALSSMFLAPTVSIIPREMSKNTFTVLGRVRRPGLYPLNQSVSVRQAIGIAGGLMLEPELVGSPEQSSRFFVQTFRSHVVLQPYTGYNVNLASLRDSFLIRDGKKININFEELVYTGDQSQDIILKPGDYLYIASDDRREVYVLGAVPGPVALAYQDNLTVMKALTMAGGWRMGGPFGADMQNVMILRGSLECPQVMRLDLCFLIKGMARDVFLQPGDILYVHNKKFRFGRELVYMAVTTFINSFLNSGGQYFAERHF